MILSPGFMFHQKRARPLFSGIITALTLALLAIAAPSQLAQAAKKPNFSNTLQGIGPCESPLLSAADRIYSEIKALSNSGNVRVWITLKGKEFLVDILSFDQYEVLYAGLIEGSNNRNTVNFGRSTYSEIESIRPDLRPRPEIEFKNDPASIKAEFQNDETTPTTAVDRGSRNIPIHQVPKHITKKVAPAVKPGETTELLVQIYQDFGFSLYLPIQYKRPQLLDQNPEAYFQQKYKHKVTFVTQGGMHKVYLSEKDNRSTFKAFIPEALQPIADTFGVSLDAAKELIPELEVRQKVLAEMLRIKGFLVAPHLANEDQIRAGESRTTWIDGISLSDFCRQNDCRQWPELLSFEDAYQQAFDQDEIISFFEARFKKVFPNENIVIAQTNEHNNEKTAVGIDKKRGDLKLKPVSGPDAIPPGDLNRDKKIIKHTQPNGEEKYFLIYFIEG